MKIKKHGKTFNKEEATTKEKFICENCECEFTVKDDEYYVGNAGAESNGRSSGVSFDYYISTSMTVRDYLVCSCPECHKICKKIRERKTQNYYVTPTITTNTLDFNRSNKVIKVAETSANCTCEDALDEALRMK